MKRGFFVALLGALLMHAIVAAQQASVAPQATGLQFFKNYFVTGDYIVGGVNLRGQGVGGVATGIIDLSVRNTIEDPDNLNTIPDNVDIVAAFLYWETVQTDNSGFGSGVATFRGTLPDGTLDPVQHDISLIAKIVNPLGTSPCWSSGGGTGGADGAHKMFLYRADVLRYIPIKPATGKRFVKTQYEVRLPDAGSGNSVPSTAGASLVVVYKDPTKPLKSIVIYNGGYNMDNSTRQMTRTINGFYQAGWAGASGTIDAKMTHIVGDGSTSKSDRLSFASGDTATNVIGTNLFQGLVTPSSDPAWDNYTFNASPYVTQDASSVTTTVDPNPLFSPFDCLSWGAIVFSTTVQDTDNDGLVDVWETGVGANHVPVTDPNGQALPDLYNMGARKDQKDIFIEIAAMRTAGYTTPAQGDVAGHDHLPSKAALDMVATSFRNAPNTPNGPGPINVHFDVGAGNIGTGKKFPTPPSATACWDNNPSTWTPECSIVPAGLSAGGESIAETACDPATTPQCKFKSYPGTVPWKTEFQLLKDQIFDHNRKDIFRLAIFAHAIGLARLDANGVPIVDNTGSYIPRNVSGTADGGGSGGGDLMVTLGFWDNFVGTDFMQGSTLMHELGHTLRLRHGGGPPTLDTNGVLRAQPNCKSNYESVMSYLFQMAGLVCDSNSASLTPQCAGKPGGTPVLDYSRQALGPANGLSEMTLSEASPGLGGMIYRTRWFSPTSALASDPLLATPPASRHCDGTRLDGTAADPGLFRIEGTNLTTIDWNGDLVIDPPATTGGPQDINASGPNKTTTPATFSDGPFAGFNDWVAVDLRQVGSRRNVASLGGPLSLDQGQGDNGQGDNGQGDNGQGDNGQGDNGQGDNGQGDNGQGDNGQGDNGAPVGDADLETARAIHNAPTLLLPTVVKTGVSLSWTPPHVDASFVTNYWVWRVIGTTVTPGNLGTKVLVTSNPLPKSPTAVIDTTAKTNVTYTYWVQAQFSTGVGKPCATGQCLSGVSNYQTILNK